MLCAVFLQQAVTVLYNYLILIVATEPNQMPKRNVFLYSSESERVNSSNSINLEYQSFDPTFTPNYILLWYNCILGMTTGWYYYYPGSNVTQILWMSSFCTSASAQWNARNLLSINTDNYVITLTISSSQFIIFFNKLPWREYFIYRLTEYSITITKSLSKIVI